MSDMTGQRSIRGWQKLANFFGVVGYILLALEWVWVAALYLPLLMDNRIFQEYILPQDKSISNDTVAMNEPSLLLTMAAVTVSLIVIVTTAIILVKLPLKFAKSSHKIIKQTAEAGIPIFTRHQKITKKKRKLLTARIALWLKVSLAIIPLFSLVGVYYIEPPIPLDVYMIVSLFLSFSVLIFFLLQYVVAYLKKIPSENLL
jgi:hypothetical protein